MAKAVHRQGEDLPILCQSPGDLRMIRDRMLPEGGLRVVQDILAKDEDEKMRLVLDRYGQEQMQPFLWMGG